MDSNYSITPKKRVEFIDSLKGFLILSVVMCHVAGYCIGIQDDIMSFQPIMFEFRNPPFFFISGFLAYKTGVVWNEQYTFTILKKKFQVIVWPTIVFLLMLLYLHPSFNNRSFIRINNDIWFYWFTLCLFLFFFFYSIIEYLIYKSKCGKIAENTILLLLGALSYLFFSVQSIYERIPLEPETKYLLGMINWGYFFFFTLGVLAKKNLHYFETTTNNQFFIGLCVLVFVLFNVFHQPLIDHHFNLYRIVTYLTGIILVFVFFKTTQLPLLIKKFFILSGRRTLDIYLIHYFLLPLALYPNTSIFRETPMPILELVVTILISLAIIAMSLLISCVLRISKTSAFIFFGDKNNNK